MVNSSAFVGISSVSFHNGHSWLGPASSTFTLRWRSLLNTLDGATRFFFKITNVVRIFRIRKLNQKRISKGEKNCYNKHLVFVMI